MCLVHTDRRQALRLRRTASRLWGLTATRVAGRSALVPSMAGSVRRCWSASSVVAAADLGVCQEARQLPASRVEGSLLGFGLAMGEQRPAIVADEAANDLLDWPLAEVSVHLQCADDFAAQSPNVVAMSTQGPARQMQGQQVAQEWLETFHQPQTGRNIARLVFPAAWPLIEVRAPGLQGIGASLLRR